MSDAFPIHTPLPPRQNLVRSLLPEYIAVAEGMLLADETALWPEEYEIIKQAIPKRQKEFITGRVFARRALDVLGAPAQPLLRDASGIPIWPKGFTGSITHSSGYCAVAIAPTSRIKAIGIDMETTGRITAAMEPYIATQQEIREILGPLQGDERQRMVTAVFSIKEALIKNGHAPKYRTVHQSASITLTLDIARGKATLVDAPDFSGSFAFSGEYVASAWITYSK